MYALCMQCVCICMLVAWGVESRFGRRNTVGCNYRPWFHRILQLTPIITDITKSTDVTSWAGLGTKWCVSVG